MSTAEHRRDLNEVLLALGACNETPQDAVPWARPYGGDWERALEACPQRVWIFWLAGALIERGHLKPAILVTTACACARRVLHLVPDGEDRPRLAVEAAERWVRGEATVDEVRTARGRAGDAATGPDAEASAYWAAHAADRSGATYALSVTDAARHAASAAANAHAPAAILALVKRELGPALLEGLTAYAATLPTMETAK